MSSTSVPNDSLYFFLQKTKNTTPSAHHASTMPHSWMISDPPLPGIQYMATMKPDMITAIVPKNLYAGTLYGLGISGSFLRKIINERATMQYATQHPKLPASLIHTSIFLPAKGASIVRDPMRISALIGVLCFG